MADISASNAVLTLTIPGLNIGPVKLQGFAADDVFGFDEIDAAEEMMGVDGVLSAGMIYVAIPQNITLQADSASNAIFDSWRQSEVLGKRKFFANGFIMLPAIAKAWAMNNGVLKRFPPLPDVKKVLQPRKYGLVWESVQPAPI